MPLADVNPSAAIPSRPARSTPEGVRLRQARLTATDLVGSDAPHRETSTYPWWGSLAVAGTCRRALRDV